MKFIRSALIGLFMAGCATAPMQMPKQEVAAMTAAGSSIEVQIYSSRPLSITSVKSIAGSGLAAKLSKSENLPYGAAIMKKYDIENASRQLAEK